MANITRSKGVKGFLAIVGFALGLTAGKELNDVRHRLDQRPIALRISHRDVKRLERAPELEREKQIRRILEAALTPHFGVSARNAAIDAVTTLMNGGSIKFYDGTQPTDCTVAVSTQTLLATITLQNPAFGSASAGSGAANGVPLTATIAANGTCTWFRVFKSDGTTVVHDGSVGTTGCNCNLNTNVLVSAATLSISAFTITHAA